MIQARILEGSKQRFTNKDAIEPSIDSISVPPVVPRFAGSAGFFRSTEFQERGYFIYRFYSAALRRVPRYAELIPDMAKVSLTDAEKEANKVAFVQEFMARAEFSNRYSSITAPAAYVDALCKLPARPTIRREPARWPG